jgi:hypothetical protein
MIDVFTREFLQIEAGRLKAVRVMERLNYEQFSVMRPAEIHLLAKVAAAGTCGLNGGGWQRLQPAQ